MPVTIQEVATLAGVSASTVSRVLNRNHDISPRTVEVVENAIRDLGYRRADTPRGRRPTRRLDPGQKSASLALLIPDTHIEAMLTPLTGQLLHGAEAAARAHDYNFLLTRLAEDGGLPPCLAPVQVDGLIVRSGSLDVGSIFPAIPIVWVFKAAQGHSQGDMVYPDNEAIGQMAASTLLENGGRLALINAIPDHPEAQIRVASFAQTVESAGASATIINLVNADMTAAVDQLLTEVPGVTGVFLPIGDDYVDRLYRELKIRGIQPVEDIAIISCSNDAARLRTLDSRLPNIDIRADEIGRTAAETLLWRIEHPSEHRRCILVEPRLVRGAKF